MANFEVNPNVPPPKEQDTKSVVYHINDNPFGLPISMRAFVSLVIGVVFLAIAAAVATFIIISSRANQNVPQEVVPTPAPTTPLNQTEFPSPTPIPEEFLLPTQPPATPSPTLSLESQKTFTSSKYGYSFSYPTDWSSKDFGSPDSKTAEMVGFNPTSFTTSDQAAILVAVKNRTYEEEIAIGTGSTKPTSVDGINGTKRTWQDSKGTTYIKIVIPLNSKALIFVTKSIYENDLNKILNSFSLTSTLGTSTESDGGNPYIEEE